MAAATTTTAIAGTGTGTGTSMSTGTGTSMSTGTGTGTSSSHAKAEPTSTRPPPPTAALLTATTPAEVRAALAALHARSAAVTARLAELRGSHAELNQSLARLDNLRAGLGVQGIAARTISSTMLAGAAATAAHLSGRVRALDLEKSRVEATLRVVEQVAELKACVAGVVGSMGAPQDWEAAAGYIARAARVPEDVVRGGFAAAVVPTVEVPDPPWVTLEAARESLCGLFLREFQRAAADGDGPKVTRFFKLFPLIGRGHVGLDVYGQYVCQGVAGTARAVLKDANSAAQPPGGRGGRDGFFHANALTRLFEHVAHIVDAHGSLVERHYGQGKMVKVIERLQAEVDIQGGIILDSWSDERGVDRKLTDVKSYPFSFLVQSYHYQQPRTKSPAVGAGATEPRSSEDEGVNMREVDALLSEIAVMLGRWSLYSRFLAGKCRDPDAPDDAPLSVPDVVVKSNLARKVFAKLIDPYITMTHFFVRRSVEKAFQLDEFPIGLSLNMHKAIEANPPYIISAVDDVMYIVNTIIQKCLSSSQRAVLDQVVPGMLTLLGADFIGMIQRKMRDEYYPKPLVQGGFPPEDKIVAFIVLINSLDLSNEYLARIIATHTGSSAPRDGATPHHPHPPSALKESFPFRNDAREVVARLNSLLASFVAKSNELSSEGLQRLFMQVIKPRVRLILPETFRDTDYTLTEHEALEAAAASAANTAANPGTGGGGGADGPGAVAGGEMLNASAAEELLAEQVGRRFEHGWDALMRPLARLLTPRAAATALDLTARYLARMLEKRVWGYAGRASAYGVIRMERDVGAIVSVVSRGNYAVREVFARTVQVLVVANMEDDEWEEMQAAAAGEEGGGMAWVLSEEEKRRARALVRVV
ncbi:hypothetical protein P8C59_004967 [Phyllachora maydis]|uniref:Conserved oligomeric Golgi complex subunit 4 n=1 Tax=Phyllachora maydis TaxID=1825666 RepID=A0AAD9I3I4_9PEZI|nr:hypothetical protein P8C59_004967 [Phyllachora maydis]